MLKKLTLILCLAVSLSFAELPLVKNGAATAEIVLPANSAAPVIYASEELRDHIRMITGAELPIVAVPTGKNAIVLSVADKQFADDLKAIGTTDGYAVRQKGNAVHVIGAIPKGVLNGVYKLLFNNTDIIWARPNPEFGTIYTETKDLTLTKTDWIDVPKYILRGWQFPGGATGLPSDIWQFRQGSNWAANHMRNAPESAKYGLIKEHGGGHNLNGIYISGEKYYKDHPEYFPLINGVRQDPRSIRMRSQLCFTNQDMTKEFIRLVDNFIQKDPDYDTYRIMIEDNYHTCQCEKCLAPISLPDGSVLTKDDKAFLSTRFFLWLNKIAAFMREKHPGKRILTFAYFFTETPPKIKVDPIISISYCPIYKNSKFDVLAPENEAVFKRVNDWLANTPNVTWREYYGLCAAFPRPIDAIAISDWRYMNSKGCVRTYSEMRGDYEGNAFNAATSWDVNSMYFWILANANWDPFRMDVKQFRRLFLERVYKQAADDVEEFYAIIEKDFIPSPGSSKWNDNPFANYAKTIIKNNHVDACQAALDRAFSKGLTGKRLVMLQHLRNTFNMALDETTLKNRFGLHVSKTPLEMTALAFEQAPWTVSVKLDDFFGEDNSPAADVTLMRAFHEDKDLILGFKAFIRPGSTLDYDKAKFSADGEAICLDITSINNRVNVFHFAFDPAGHKTTAKTPWSIIASPTYQGAMKFQNYNGKWAVSTEILPDGWFAAVRIPAAKLNANPADGIRIAVTRVRKAQGQSAKASYFCASKPSFCNFYGIKNYRKVSRSFTLPGSCMEFKPENFKLPEGERKQGSYNSQRWHSDVIISGTKGETVSFTLGYNQVNMTAADCNDTITLHGPGGITIPMGTFTCNQDFREPKDSKAFSAVLPETGVYQLPLDPGFHAYFFRPSKDLKWALHGSVKHNSTLLIRPTTRGFKGYFEVPAGVKDFFVEFIGGSGADSAPCPVRVRNPQDEIVKENLNFEMPLALNIHRESTASEVWSFEVDKPTTGIYIRLPLPLTNIWANSPGNLPRLK